MRVLVLAVLVGMSSTHVLASEADPGPQVNIPESRRTVPRGYLPPPPPRYYEPAPRVRLGDLCEVEGRSGLRTCDLRRAAPIGSYCECVSPSGRAREGRVTR